MSIHFASDLDMSDEGRRQRTERDAQISAANTLVELLGEVQHIRVALTRSSDSRSSIEIKTSTRGYDISVKTYDGSPTDGLVDEAIAMYGETFRKVQEQSAHGWAETVASLKPEHSG